MARGKQGVYAQYLQMEFLDYLEEECRRLLEKAIETSTFQNRTYNLYDSYGYGIFLNGSLKRTNATFIKEGDVVLGAVGAGLRPNKATKPRKWYNDEIWGRGLRDMVFDGDSGYNPGSKRGYVIVLAATMPYAVVLEAGGYRRKVRKRDEEKQYKLHPSIYKPLGDLDVRYKEKYKVITQIVADCEDIGKSLCGKSLVSHVELKREDFFNKYAPK